MSSVITEDARCQKEIKHRIIMAKEAFNKRRELLVGRLNLAPRKKMIKTLAWPVLLYGCETWTLRKE